MYSNDIKLMSFLLAALAVLRYISAMENKKNKLVYLKNSELIADNKTSDYDILQSVELCHGDNVKCLQLDRDLWRIYLSKQRG